METLELISVNVWHIAAAIANLLILTLIVKKFLFQPVQKVLAERQAEVDGLYQKAEDAASAAAEDKRLYGEKLANADREAAELVQAAVSRAERLSDEIVSEANARADAAVRKADADIEQSRKKAVNELKNEIAGISLSIAEKVVAREINEKDHEELVDDFIERL